MAFRVVVLALLGGVAACGEKVAADDVGPGELVGPTVHLEGHEAKQAVGAGLVPEGASAITDAPADLPEAFLDGADRVRPERRPGEDGLHGVDRSLAAVSDDELGGAAYVRIEFR